jgi:Flp pilus assembly protein TadD
MKLLDLDNALAAFSRVVQLQPENGEAWANAAAVHCQKGNHWNEAFRCIREAVRYHRNNWRMWDSYIKISVKVVPNASP